MKVKTLLRAAALSVLAMLGACSGTDGGTGGGDGGIARYPGDGTVGPAALRDVVEPLFAGNPSPGDTRAVLLLHDGQVVAERYAPGYGPDTSMLSWSMAKTVTAVLVGIMVSDGRLALDDPLPLPAWRQGGDPRGAITLREMLTMSSGIAHKEREGPIEDTDALRLLVGDGAADMARYAEAKPLARAPGRTFQYNSATTLILCDVMARLLTDSHDPRARRDAMMRFVRQRLAEPVGLTSLRPEFDAHGTMIGGAMMHMTARDYAKLGELLRNGGRAHGRQIVSAAWVRFMTRPSAANAGYGAHLWLNRPGAESTLFPGRASPSIFAAVGLFGQYVIVSPRQHLTLVRLGVSRDDDMPALRDALARLFERMPAR